MKNLFLGALMAVFMSSAMADEDRLVEINGKKVMVNDVKAKGKPDLVKFKTSELKRGVFVNAQGMYALSLYLTPLPNANQFVRQILEKKGIKVVDKLEDADLSLSFGVDGSTMNMKLVDRQATGGAVANKVIIQGSVITGMAVGGGAGAGAILGGILGSFVPHDETVSIIGVGRLNPALNKNWIKSSTDNDYEYSISLDYRLAEKDEEKADSTDMFEMLMNEWVNAFVEFDTPVEAAAAV